MHKTIYFLIPLFTLCSLIYPSKISAQDSIDVPISSEPSIIKYTFNPKELILPASLITVGTLGTAISGMNDFHLLSRKDSVRQIRVDDYLEWGMLGWVFICDLMGQEKHHFTDQFLLLLVAEGLNAGMVRGLKRVVNEPRPDGGPHSFPSGHTANVFLGAHLAYKEFRESNLLLAYSGYPLALFVGISRIYNNRHWIADTIAGAGFGILSVELAYLIYFPIRNSIMKTVHKKRKNEMMVLPTITTQQVGLTFALNF